jgi:hypothetical protein
MSRRTRANLALAVVLGYFALVAYAGVVVLRT